MKDLTRRFLERGFRNIELPPLSEADVADIEGALDAAIANAVYARANPHPESNETELIVAIEGALICAAKCAEAEGRKPSWRELAKAAAHDVVEASRPTPSAGNDVTEEMIDAGIAAMDNHGRALNSATVTAIYTVMSAARTLGDERGSVEQLIFREAIKRGVNQDTADQVAQAVVAALSTASKEGSHGGN